MQIDRLFKIVYILLENPVITAAELAKRFEVSQRTIYRDVETLSQAGIPVYMSKGKGGGISLLPDFVLNKAVLTEQDKSEILSSMRAFSAVNLGGSSSAFDKLSAMLGRRNTDWIEVDFSSWGFFENDENIFKSLKAAIIEKREVEFLYASGKAEKLLREVLPLKLVFKGAAWYLYGFCKMRNDYRFFKLRRIKNLTVSDEYFALEAPIDVISAEKIDTSGYLKAVFCVSGKMAFRVYDEISSFSVDENGKFLCELYLPDIDSICSYAASFGEFCTVIEPKEAVAEMRNRLENSLKNYL